MNWMPEQRLWQAVVNAALHDATNTAWREELYQKQAIRWFRDGGKDFKMVCDMAGYDYRYIQHKFERLMERKQKHSRRSARVYPCEKNRN